MKLTNKIVALVFFVLLGNLVHAEPASGVLENYKKNDVFICVGIYSCVSLALALEAGFEELHGVDEDNVLVEHAKIIFPKDICSGLNKVKSYAIHLGGTTELARIIAQIKRPITFLLSSHFPDIDQIKENNILKELDIIKNHPIKTHTILIEYIQYAGTPCFGNISLKSIKEKLLTINPDYVFSYEMGGHLQKDPDAVLIARLEDNSFRRSDVKHKKYIVRYK